jgi:hypothetical protein
MYLSKTLLIIFPSEQLSHPGTFLSNKSYRIIGIYIAYLYLEVIKQYVIIVVKLMSAYTIS